MIVQNESSPLHFAARDVDPTLVQLLLRRGAEVNAPDKVLQPSFFDVQYDLNSLAVVVAQAGWTPLHESAANGRPEAIQLLLAASADANAADKVQCTPCIVQVVYICE